MKRVAALVGAVMLACTASAAQAQNWYVGGYGGMNYTHDGDAGAGNVEYDLGLAFGGIVGYAMANGLRVEGEIAYRWNDVDTIAGAPSGSELSSWAFMGNVLYDINTQTSLTPHIGGGVGVARATVETGGIEFNDTVLAGQLIAGADYNVAPDLALTVDYRLFFTEDLGLGAGGGLGGAEYVNSTISVGLRKSF